VLDRALAVMVACMRLAKGRKQRPTAAIIDTQSVRTGPQRGTWSERPGGHHLMTYVMPAPVAG
jgi:hypothetical protein